MANDFLDIAEWKKAPTPGKPLRKYAGSLSGAVDAQARTATFVISDDTIDRDGDTIDVKGWDLDAYKKNAVLLYAHDYGSLPIGKCVKGPYVEDGKLKATFEFKSHQLANDVWDLVKDGTLSATSVGFKPKQYVENADRRGTWGFPAHDFKAQELLEVSVVPVPSNPNALLDGKSLAKAFAAFRRAAEPNRKDGDDDDVMASAHGLVSKMTDLHAKALELHGRKEAAVATLEKCVKALNEDIGADDPKDGKGAPGGKTKTARVLSEKNYGRVKAAMDHCKAVIDDHHAAHGEPDPEEPDEDDKAPKGATLKGAEAITAFMKRLETDEEARKAFAAYLQSEVAKQMNKLRGRLPDEPARS